MLDTALSYHLDSSLMGFRLSDFGDKVNIGSFLLFLVSFSFLLAFIIPVIKQFLTFFFLMAIPWKIRSCTNNVTRGLYAELITEWSELVLFYTLFQVLLPV